MISRAIQSMGFEIEFGVLHKPIIYIVRKLRTHYGIHVDEGWDASVDVTLEKPSVIKFFDKLKRIYELSYDEWRGLIMNFVENYYKKHENWTGYIPKKYEEIYEYLRKYDEVRALAIMQTEEINFHWHQSHEFRFRVNNFSDLYRIVDMLCDNLYIEVGEIDGEKLLFRLFATNETCGTHIHISVSPSLFYVLTDINIIEEIQYSVREFIEVDKLLKVLEHFKSFLEKYKHQILLDYHNIDDYILDIATRLDARFYNEQCLPYASELELYSNILLKEGHVDRKRFMNFAACDKYGTVEFRIFPGIKHPIEILVYGSILVNVIDYVYDKYVKNRYLISRRVMYV